MGDHRGGVGHSNRVGNNRGSVDSMGNHRGGMDSVGNDGGSVHSVGNRDSIRVLGLTSIRHLGDIAINVVGVVGDSLDTAVGKVDRVGSLNNTGAIVALSLAEGSLGVVVGNAIVVGVRGYLSQIANSVDSDRGGVGNSVDNGGGVDNRGSVDSVGSMDNGGGVDGMGDGVGKHRGGMVDSVVGNGVGSMGNYWSGVGNSVVGNWVSHVGSHGNNSGMSNGDGPVGSDGRLDLREALGVVSLSDRGMGGAEGLGLDKGPLLAVGSGDRLVGGLATNCDGVGNSVGDTVANQDLGGSRGSSEDCSKANEGLKYAISQKVKADSFLFSVSPSFCSVQVFWID